MMEKKENLVGLKCGLEIHQQLDTGKLFCRCRPRLHEEKSHWITHRYLQPAASETGEFDKAALEQFQRGESFVYHAYPKTNCLVDLDEEPPHEIDKEALLTTAKIALMTNSSLFDEVYTMRKLVIDGSNVSGFQRTALVAANGHLEVNGKRIGIQSIAVEEDSARPLKIANEKNEVHYNLDRLGTPLIELATDASIQTPQECLEVAKKIGELFRLTGMARRGLGTIRQDVNISIRGGARVEIKGCQNLELLPQVVEHEIKRQESLLQLSQQLQQNGRHANGFDARIEIKPMEVSALFSSTDSKLVKGKKVVGAKVCGFAGILGSEVQPGRRFGTEVSNYVKRISGKGIVHSDELPHFGITEQEVSQLRQQLNCQDHDAFVLTADPQDKTELIFKTIENRCQMVIDCVIPEETRQCLEDGNSEYLRPLPGAARMYPETDIQPIRLTPKTISRIKQSLPESVEKRFEKFTKQFGLSSQLAQKMVLANEAIWFEELVKQGANPTMAAVTLLETFIMIERDIPSFDYTEFKEPIASLILAGSKDKILKDRIESGIRALIARPEMTVEELIKHQKEGIVDASEWEKVVDQVVKDNQEVIKERKERAFAPLMGDVMKQLRGKADPVILGKMIHTKIKEVLK